MKKITKMKNIAETHPLELQDAHYKYSSQSIALNHA